MLDREGEMNLELTNSGKRNRRIISQMMLSIVKILKGFESADI
jgi:hypothetical protein